MAESVERHIEKTIPHLEQLERVGLFNNAEIKLIIRNRRSHEYKLRRSAKNKDDYLKYVQYEINLLNLIKHRRVKIGYHYKKGEIDDAIAQGINRLFKAAIFRYQDDIALWFSHIEFLKKMNWKGIITKMYSRMLQVHNKSPEVWIVAAKWELEENDLADNTRSLLQRALRFHPESEQLWLEYFRLELLLAEKMRKSGAVVETEEKNPSDQVEQSQQEEEEGGKVNEAVLEGKIAEIVFKNSIEHIKGVNFIVRFLDITRQFEFTHNLEEIIYTTLSTEYRHTELSLDALAKRPLLRKNEEIEKRRKCGDSKKRVLKEIEDTVFNLYEEAIQKCDTDEMWSCYIRACFDRISEAPTEKHAARNLQNCLKVFERAHESRKLQQSLYLDWVSLLEDFGDSSKLDDVLSSAVVRWPKDVKLWEKYITINVNEGREKVLKLFNNSIDNVDAKEAIPLWILIVDWLMVASPDEVVCTLQKGIIMCGKSGVPLQIMYLEYSTTQRGIKSARNSFWWIHEKASLAPQVVRRMVDLENAQVLPSIEHLRKYYEAGIQQFGRTDYQIWLDYIKLEETHENGERTKTGQIYWSAKQTLDPCIVDTFVTRHTLDDKKH